MAHILDTINKFPVAIISVARSGSTAIGEYIATKNKATWINEPYMFSEKYHTILECDVKEIPYVAKFIVGMTTEIEEKTLLNAAVKISLRRRSIINQIVSIYIARERDVWRQLTPFGPEYTIPVDTRKLKEAVLNIVDHNVKLDYYERQIDFDLILYYEDLNLEEKLLFSSYKTVQPTNVAEITTAAIKIAQENNLMDYITQKSVDNLQ